jgi:hypothetical protein
MENIVIYVKIKLKKKKDRNTTCMKGACFSFVGKVSKDLPEIL